ncbi:MAG: hypothetical protein K0Q71_717 [Thermomicrobiales bacterium]|jgi:hypothetical protein|nr:hypothetical protein [Thermomicrobiales bacterium]
MDQFKMAIVVMAFCEVGGGPRGAEGRRRQYTAEERDALAERGWDWPDFNGGILTTLANAVRPRRRPRAILQLDPAPLAR